MKISSAKKLFEYVVIQFLQGPFLASFSIFLSLLYLYSANQ